MQSKLRSVWGFAVFLCAFVPTVAAADYDPAFAVGGKATAPLTVQSGAAHVRDSDVGNQNYNLQACYLAKNNTSKTIVLERYRIDVFSSLDGKIGTRQADLKHTIEPDSLDQPFANESELSPEARSVSECLEFINIWGESISKITMTPIAVEYSDGSTWKLQGTPAH